jgi:hypothetical protein
MLYDSDGDDDHFGYGYPYPIGPIKKTNKKIRFTETFSPLFGDIKFSIDEIIHRKNHNNQSHIFNLLEDSSFKELSKDDKLKPFYGINAECYFGFKEYVNPADGSVFVIEPGKEKFLIRFVRNFDPLQHSINVTLRDKHQVKFKMDQQVNKNFVSNKCITNIKIDASNISKWGYLELGSHCGNFYPTTLQSQYFHSTHGKVRLFFYREEIVDRQYYHPLMNVRTEADQTFVPVHKGQLLSIRIPCSYGHSDPKTEGLKFNSKTLMKEADQYQFVYMVEKNPIKDRVAFLVSDFKNYRCVIGCPVGRSYEGRFRRTMRFGDPIHNSIVETQGVDHLEVVFYSTKLPRLQLDETFFSVGSKTITRETSSIALGLKKPMSHVLVARYDKDVVKLIPVS